MISTPFKYLNSTPCFLAFVSMFLLFICMIFVWFLQSSRLDDWIKTCLEHKIDKKEARSLKNKTVTRVSKKFFLLFSSRSTVSLWLATAFDSYFSQSSWLTHFSSQHPCITQMPHFNHENLSTKLKNKFLLICLRICRAFHEINEGNSTK